MGKNLNIMPICVSRVSVPVTLLTYSEFIDLFPP
jgi:hypothetical protein